MPDPRVRQEPPNVRRNHVYPNYGRPYTPPTPLPPHERLEPPGMVPSDALLEAAVWLLQRGAQWLVLVVAGVVVVQFVMCLAPR